MTNHTPRPYDRGARAFIEKTVATARGWRVLESHPNQVDGEPVFLYIYDVSSCYTWMARVNFDGFMAAAAHIRNDGEEVQATVAAHLGALIGDLVKLRALVPTPRNLKAMDELLAGDLAAGLPGLFQLTTLQAGSSSMIFEDGLLKAGGHFILLCYNTLEHVHLRSLVLPAEMTGATGIMDGDTLTQVLSEVIASDQEHFKELGA